MTSPGFLFVFCFFSSSPSLLIYVIKEKPFRNRKYGEVYGYCCFYSYSPSLLNAKRHSKPNHIVLVSVSRIFLSVSFWLLVCGILTSHLWDTTLHCLTVIMDSTLDINICLKRWTVFRSFVYVNNMTLR